MNSNGKYVAIEPEVFAKALLGQCSSQADAKNIILCAAELLHVQFVILGASFQLLEESRENLFAVLCKDWDKSVLNKRERKTLPYFDSSDPRYPFLIRTRGSGLSMLASELWEDHHLLGYLIATTDEESAVPCLYLLGKLLGKVIRRSAYYRSDLAIRKASLLEQIISGAGKAELSAQIRDSKWQPCEYMRIGVIDMSHNYLDSTSRFELCDAIAAALPRSLFRVSEVGVELLITYPDLDEQQAIYTSLESILSQRQLRLCFGCAFSDYNYAGISFLQASAVHELAEQCAQGFILCYEDLLWKHVLKLCGQNTVNNSIHPLVWHLLAADKRNNGESYKTLCAYLACGYDTEKACEALHIHRNTLSYRLDKIIEETNINLDDAEFNLKFQVSSRLLDAIRG